MAVQARGLPTFLSIGADNRLFSEARLPDCPPDTQPMAFAGSGAPPTFLAAGRTDSGVKPERNTAALAARLSAAGLPVHLHRCGRVNHLTLTGAFGLPLRWLAPVLDDVGSFVLNDQAARPDKSQAH